MAKKTEKIIKGAMIEKVEHKDVPSGFVHCIVLKNYEEYREGESIVLVERRFKSLSFRGFVKEV